MKYKRLVVSTILGMILGVFCILGASQRIPGYVTNNILYLSAAWYNRVIMGVIIGLAGEIEIIKGNNFLNSLIRGALIGALVSVGFGLLGQSLEIMFFIAGIGFGTLNDVISTKIM
ncbi:MAG: hypothetical protein GF364_05240 [Candidatus Lokiarchaeota archaeon]|nr:hypothetical protein [Candidatus Lokiarchaeota archaeon]